VSSQLQETGAYD